MKAAPKPPHDCPVCGEPRRSATAEWGRFPGGRGRFITIPVALIAVYFCGAAIAMRYIARPAFGLFAGRHAGADWQTEITQGCIGITRHMFDQSVHAPAASRAAGVSS